MFHAAGGRGGLPVLLSRGIDLPAASAPGGFRRSCRGRRFFRFRRLRPLRCRGRPAASRGISQLLQETGCPVTNSADLLLESRHIHPPVGLRLYRADQSTQLLGERDYALLDRVG